MNTDRKKAYPLNAYNTADTYHFNPSDFLGFLREQQVKDIQTVQGLKQYLLQHYNLSVTDFEQFNELLNDIREHFKGEPKTSDWLHKEIKEMEIENKTEALSFLFYSELKPIIASSGILVVR